MAFNHSYIGFGYGIGGGGGSAGSSVPVYDEGILIGTGLLNFVGPGVQAVPNASFVDVYVGSAPTPFAISSFNLSVNSAEVGQIVSGLTLSWTYNNGNIDPDVQSINQGIGSLAVNLRNHIFGSNITNNLTFTLSASKNAQNTNSSKTISFIRRIYWGVSSDPNIGNSPFSHGDLISANFSHELKTSRQQTRVFDCTGGNYFYFAFPDSYGTVIPQLQVGPFPVTLTPSNSRIASFTNQYGDVVNYRVYRSDNLQFGDAISVQVL